MSTKTFSIRDEVYKLLRDVKREGESFSDVIERLVKKDKMGISEFFGVMKNSRVLKELEEDSKKSGNFRGCSRDSDKGQGFPGYFQYYRARGCNLLIFLLKTYYILHT